MDNTAQWPQGASTTSGTVLERRSSALARPRKEQALNCPRCNSTNTKFCYYNNYSLSQPRYFCKGCRRFWTQGGSLRNVPVGGGSRKNKRSSSSSSSSSSSAIKKITYDQHYLMGPPPSLLIDPSSLETQINMISKIHQGQGRDLNLAYKSPSQDHQDQGYACRLPKFVEVPFLSTASAEVDNGKTVNDFNPANPNSCSSSMELLLKSTGSVIDSTGLETSPFLPIPVSEGNTDQTYASGFRLQEFKPSRLNLLQDGLDQSACMNLSSARMLFPSDGQHQRQDLKSGDIRANDAHHEFEQNADHSSCGYWGGVLRTTGAFL